MYKTHVYFIPSSSTYQGVQLVTVPLLIVVYKFNQATTIYKIAPLCNNLQNCSAKQRQVSTKEDSSIAAQSTDTPWLLQTKATKEVEMECLRTPYVVLKEFGFELRKIPIHPN
jgi:hypothetical protein